MPVTRLTSAFILGVGAAMGLAPRGIASREWDVIEAETRISVHLPAHAPEEARA